MSVVELYMMPFTDLEVLPRLQREDSTTIDQTFSLLPLVQSIGKTSVFTQ
jgi:hypothetical protein